MKELFDIPESLSPKLRWMKEHGINTHYSKDYDPEFTEDEFGNELHPWSAFKGTIADLAKEIVTMEDDGRFVTASTEEEALWQLSQNLKIPFYK